MAFLSLGALGASARAQDSQAGADAQQRQAAAEAFDRGTAAYLARNYPQAAEWFETANRLASSAPALIQAVRANQRAGNTLRAGTLALRLVAQYPEDRSAARTAEGALAEATTRYVRVEVACEGCTVDLDGTLQESQAFFVEPDADHRIVAHFTTGEREERFRGGAGERREIRFEAPPPPPPGTGGTATGTTGTGTSTGRGTGGGTRTPRASSGLPPAVALVGIAVTVAAGGVLAWSAIDTQAGVDEYEAARTEELLDEGRSKELRTNILIAGTATVGAVTAILMFLTDWSDDEESTERAPAAPPVRVSAAFVPGGAMGVLGGSF